MEKFLQKCPSFKIVRNWHVDEGLIAKKLEWEYFSEEEASYIPGKNENENNRSNKRRRKWIIAGEKQIDYSEGVF